MGLRNVKRSLFFNTKTCTSDTEMQERGEYSECDEEDLKYLKNYITLKYI